MNRRNILALIGGVAAWPVAARAQQGMPVVGVLLPESFEAWRGRVAALQQGLAEIGYIEGQNVAFEYRSAESRVERLPALAADLVLHRVAVIAAAGIAAALAAKAATAVIPTVFSIGSDPVRVGLVASLSRPGGNVTGVTNLASTLEAKRLELLHELAPQVTTFAFLANPTNPNLQFDATDVQTAAATLGKKLVVLSASDDRGIDAAFATMTQQGIGGLLVAPDTFFINRHEQLTVLAARHALPAIYPTREFVATGGLVSYSGNILDAWRHAGVFTGRILKGEKPADLPVELGVKVELAINMKTAKTLGLTVPLALLTRADEVIE